MIIKTPRGRCSMCGVKFSIVPWMPWRLAGFCKACAPDELKREEPVSPLRPGR